MTLYFILSKTFEGFDFITNQFGFIVVLGWFTFGFSLLHVGNACSKVLADQDLLVSELILLQDTLKEADPELFDQLYPGVRDRLEFQEFGFNKEDDEEE